MTQATQETPPTPLTILRVALSTPLRRLFDYLLPASARHHPPPNIGTRILVPFGPRKLVGLIIEIADHSTIERDKLKHAIRVLDDQPIFSNSLLHCLKWMADYYHHPLGEVVHAALPTHLRTDNPVSKPDQRTRWSVTERGALSEIGLATNAHRQRHALEQLRQHPNGLHEDSLKQMGIKRETLVSLKNKTLVTQTLEERRTEWPKPDALLNEPPLVLTHEQASAYNTLHNSLDQFSCHLLYGVTGSGKTEVYLQLIHDCLIKQRQVLVIIPEISLTPQTVSRFQRRFNADVGVMHSNQTHLERYKTWHAARSGTLPILIGTRSSVFTRFKQLGLIIIDEEHDSSLKQQDGFRYSARDVAIYRAKTENIPILLGSATPSLETAYNAQIGRYQLHTLTARPGTATLPTMNAIDLRNARLKAGLSEHARDIIQQRLQAGEQVLIFLNRRGFAPVLICNNCGWTAHCDRCDARMILHKHPPHLHCHHCSRSTPVTHYCKACGSSDLAPVGQGTERLEEFLEETYPEYPVIRVDSDTTRKKNALSGLLEKVESQQPLILVGTQMIAKGHHFPSVTTVIISDVDGGLLSADFRGAERTLQLITQVAGRAGRAQKPGTVYLQTRLPEDPMIQCLLTNNYQNAVHKILAEREAVGFPPFGHLALFRSESVESEAAMDFLQQLKKKLQERPQERLQLLGPSPAPMIKKAGRYRAQLLLLSTERRTLHNEINHLLNWLETQTKLSKIRWSIDIDPIDLF